jgi:hypothetical protein
MHRIARAVLPVLCLTGTLIPVHSSANVEKVRELINTFNAKNVGALGEYFSEDCLIRYHSALDYLSWSKDFTGKNCGQEYFNASALQVDSFVFPDSLHIFEDKESNSILTVHDENNIPLLTDGSTGRPYRLRCNYVFRFNEDGLINSFDDICDSLAEWNVLSKGEYPTNGMISIDPPAALPNQEGYFTVIAKATFQQLENFHVDSSAMFDQNAHCQFQGDKLALGWGELHSGPDCWRLAFGNYISNKTLKLKKVDFFSSADNAAAIGAVFSSEVQLNTYEQPFGQKCGAYIGFNSAGKVQNVQVTCNSLAEWAINH